MTLFEIGKKVPCYTPEGMEYVFIREKDPVNSWDAVKTYVTETVWDTYNSVYEYHGDLSNALVDRLALDFDAPCKYREIDDILSEWRRTVVFSGSGFHFYIHTNPINEEQDAYLRGADRDMKTLLKGYIDEGVYLNPRQMIRSISSWNRKTGLSCLCLKNPKTPIEEIKRMAEHSSGKVFYQEGKLYEWGDPIHKPKEYDIEVKCDDIKSSSSSHSLSLAATEMDKPVCAFTKAFRTRLDENMFEGKSDYESRFWILLFMRDCLLLSADEATELSGKIFSEQQVRKINTKGQLRRVFKRRSYNFCCQAMKDKGFCPQDCRYTYYNRQAEYVKQIAVGEVSAEDASNALARLYQEEARRNTCNR